MFHCFNGEICEYDCEQYWTHFFGCMDEAYAFFKVVQDRQDIPEEFVFLEVNSAFERLFGKSNGEVRGKGFYTTFSGLGGSWRELYRKAAETGRSQHYEKYVKGVDRHFKISLICPVPDQLVVIFFDITKLKKAEEINRKYSILLENAQDIVLYLREDGTILEANKAAIARYGYTYEELLDIKLQQLRHPSTLKDYEKQMKEADTQGTIFECLHMCKDGSTFPVEVSSKSAWIGGEKFRVHIIRDISERKKAEEKILYLANYDSLTGIFNRARLMQQLDLTLAQAQRENFKVAVMIFDIDRFKSINDTYGHNAGDHVLQETARRVQRALRQADVFGRLGGDEFLIIQPFIQDSRDVRPLAEHLHREISKSTIQWENSRLPIHLSIGISLYPDDASTSRDLMYYADNAMYYVKKRGGNNYGFYHSAQQALNRENEPELR